MFPRPGGRRGHTRPRPGIWQTSSQPIATEELLIPEEFDESYTGYLQLQADQGFDLTQYKGSVSSQQQNMFGGAAI